MKPKKSTLMTAFAAILTTVVLILGVKTGSDLLLKSRMTSVELKMQDSESLYKNWGCSFEDLKAEIDKRDPSGEHHEDKKAHLVIDHIDNYDGHEGINASIVYSTISDDNKFHMIYIKFGKNLDEKTQKDLTNKYKYMFNKKYTKTSFVFDYLFKSKCWKSDDSLIQLMDRNGTVCIVYEDLEQFRKGFYNK